jgi:hypothetical protein
MSIQSPLTQRIVRPTKEAAQPPRVRCDLAERIDVLPGEVDLIEIWAADLITDLFVSNSDGTTIIGSNGQARKR